MSYSLYNAPSVIKAIVYAHNLMYRLIANSLPMGGPFLLMKLLESLGYRNYAQSPQARPPTAFNYKEVKDALASPSPLLPSTDSIAVSPFAPWQAPVTTFQQWLEAVPAGHYISGHLPYSAALDPMLHRLNYRHVLIWRNPHEILAELVFGEEIMPRFLRADLEPLSLAERVQFFLRGGAAPKLGADITGFAEICTSMLTWQQDSTCHLVHVEDLLDRNLQEGVLVSLADFLELDLDMTSCLQTLHNFPRPLSYLTQLYQVIAPDKLASL